MMQRSLMRIGARAVGAAAVLGALLFAPTAGRAGLIGPPANIDLSLSESAIACDGVAGTTLTAAVYDAAFQPVVDGTTVSFAVTNGSANPPSSQTVSGKVVTTIRGATPSINGVALDATAGAALSSIVIDCAEFTGRIRGVIKQNGAPLAGIRVDARRTTDFDEDTGFGVSGADGSYEIAGLDAGNYSVRADGDGYVEQFYPSPVFVSTRSITYDVDFTMTPAGSISGRVTNGANGVPFATVLIPEVFEFGQADAQGYYLVGDLPAGSYTARLFNTGALAPEFYNNSYTAAGASTIVANSGAATANINFDLTTGGSITGVIRDSNGVPLQGAYVHMENSDWFFTGVSGPGGVYTISGIAPGTYTVDSSFDGYAQTWHGQTFTPAGATPVVVSLGATTSGVDIQHLRLGSISGSVANVPVNGAFVSLEPLDCCPGGPGTDVAVSGPYSILGVQPGCYRVAVGALPFDTQYFTGHFVPELANPVCVSPNADTAGIDFVLRAKNPDFLEELIALPIPGDSTRSTAGATLEPSEPQPCGAIGATIWYRFGLPPAIAPGTEVAVDTTRSNFDTVAAVYSGNHILSPPGGIAPVTCNDNTGTPQARAVFTGTPGATYYVQIGGASGATGNAVLRVECVGDTDCDGDANAVDNCASLYNPDQANLDGDALGDVCDSDPDGDGVPTTVENANGTEAMVADTDGDGCSDGREAGADPKTGGMRDPLNYWDFYDVNGSQIIDLLDTLAILDHFGATPGQPLYDRKLDRVEPDPARPYRTAQTQSGFVIDLIDALISLDSFGYSCK